MTTAWSHLPNAVHIDRIIDSFRNHEIEWEKARNETYDLTQTVNDQAWTNAYNLVHKNKFAWDESWKTICLCHDGSACGREAAWIAITTLIAYDDCAYILDSNIEELKILSRLGNDKATLLLPACYALHLVNS